MTDIPFTPQDEADALAAEYVLGVLDLADRVAVEKRIKSDDDFAALVTAWENHFAGLNDEFAETAAPMHILEAIEARLHPTPVKQKRNWFAWIGGPVAAGALALAIAFTLPPSAPPAEVVAELVAADRSLVYQASYGDGTLQVTRVAGTGPGAGKDHELWIIAPGEAPKPLGILGDDGLRVTTERPPAGWVLAVSVEPTGGSTTGAPTGPVILTGEISA